MYRKMFGTLACALVLGAVVLADDISGKITKVDTDKETITVSVDGKETEYSVAKDAKMPKTKDKKTMEEKEVKLKDLKTRVEKAKDSGKDVKAKITTQKKDGKEVVVEIKFDAGKAAKKDKN